VPKKEFIIPKKPDKAKEILLKHKKYIAKLNAKKRLERDAKTAEEDEMRKRDQNIKEKAAVHRQKIQKWKEEMQVINKVFGGDESKTPEKNENPVKLTANNLEKHDKQIESKNEIKKIEPVPVAVESKKDEPVLAPPEKKADDAPVEPPKNTENIKSSKTPEKPSTSQKKKKPAWAMTEKQAEEVKEQEVDDLLEFAYQLDYEKFIEDFEVRQALAVLKERVQELKKDDKWKESFAEKWNKEAENAKNQGENKGEEAAAQAENDKIETQSVKSSHKSTRSVAKSIKSMADTVKEMKEKEKTEKRDWDKSVKGVEKLTVEEKAAIQIADQVLQNAPQLKGVHSKSSIRKILEREAKAQLMAKEEPKIVTVKDRERVGNMDPSNLPYLHRNEAV